MTWISDDKEMTDREAEILNLFDNEIDTLYRMSLKHYNIKLT